MLGTAAVAYVCICSFLILLSINLEALYNDTPCWPWILVFVPIIVFEVYSLGACCVLVYVANSWFHPPPVPWYPFFKKRCNQKKMEKFRDLPLEVRSTRAQGILRNPNVVPVVLEFGGKAIPGAELMMSLITVPRKAPMSHVAEFIRKKCIKVSDPKIGIYLFVGRHIAPMNVDVEQVYEQQKGEDSILYLMCSPEETFGSLWNNQKQNPKQEW